MGEEEKKVAILKCILAVVQSQYMKQLHYYSDYIQP